MAEPKYVYVLERPLLLLAMLDLGNLAVAFASWVFLLGAVDARVLAVAVVLRAIPAYWIVHRALAPIRDWRREGASKDPRQLLETRRVLGSIPRTVGTTYVGSWLAAGGISMALGYAGIPEPLPVGNMEVVVAVSQLFAMTLGISAVLLPILDSAVPRVRAEVGAALLEQRIDVDGESQKIGSRLALINLGVYTAALVALLAQIGLERTRSMREQLVAAEQGRAALLASELRHGALDQEQLEPDSRVVSATELPSELGGDLAGAEALVHLDLRDQVIMAAAPIDGGSWVLIRSSFDEEAGFVALQLLLLLSVIVAPVAVGTSALGRSLTVPLGQLSEATRRVAQEGDIRALGRVVPLSNDELGTLATNFNRMLDVFDELAVAATTVAEGDLRAEVKGRGDLHDAFRAMLTQLHDTVVQVRRASVELALAAAEIQATTKQQEQAVEAQSQRVGVVRDAVTKLARSAEQISQTADEVLENAEQTLGTTNATSGEIAELNAQANNIGELLELIREVADRSDLLALNGSLEATRAGEAGRGFGLVAAEMRRLAERVTGTVTIVRERVASISAAGASAVTATQSSHKLANDTASAARKISKITLQQSDETEQVSGRVLEVSDLMTATVASTTQAHAAAEGLHRQAAELEQLTGQFKLRAAEHDKTQD